MIALPWFWFMLIMAACAGFGLLTMAIIGGARAEQEQKIIMQQNVIDTLEAQMKLVADRACGQHRFKVGDKVKLLTDINGISGTVTSIAVNKGREPQYRVHQGGRFVGTLEHLLKPVDGPDVVEVAEELQAKVNEDGASSKVS